MNKLFNAMFAAALLGASSAASAVAIVYDATNTVSIPGIATEATYGDTMDGMSVTAVFSDGFSESLSWADIGPGSGGVMGTGWALNLSGNTFGANWNFTNISQPGLTQLVLDGAPGLTVFDVDWNPTAGDPDGFGTPGSFLGVTFADTPAVAVTATYSNQVQVGANAPVGDLWQLLTIDFATPDGIRGNFSFSQDTDNDIRATVPAPAILGLLGLGLVGMGAVRRFRA